MCVCDNDDGMNLYHFKYLRKEMDREGVSVGVLIDERMH